MKSVERRDSSNEMTSDEADRVAVHVHHENGPSSAACAVHNGKVIHYNMTIALFFIANSTSACEQVVSFGFYKECKQRVKKECSLRNVSHQENDKLNYR